MAEKKDAPKVLNLECNDGIVLGDSLNGVVETHLSVLGWSILFLLIGLVAGAAIAIGLTVANQWYDYLATVAVTTIGVVLIYRLKQSYRFIRWCQDQERTASGKRRFK